MSVLGGLQLTQISLYLKTFSCNFKIKGLGAKAWVAFYYFYFKELRLFKVKESMLLLSEKEKFNKNETESKMENPAYAFEGRSLCFSPYKNCKLKWNWCIEGRERKKNEFFNVYLP